jgi:hypothetical protein
MLSQSLLSAMVTKLNLDIFFIVQTLWPLCTSWLIFTTKYTKDFTKYTKVFIRSKFNFVVFR